MGEVIEYVIYMLVLIAAIAVIEMNTNGYIGYNGGVDKSKALIIFLK